MTNSAADTESHNPTNEVMLTAGEVYRRSIESFDAAAKFGDETYLMDISLIAATRRTIRPTGVSFVCANTSVLGRMAAFFRREYGDCIKDLAVRIEYSELPATGGGALLDQCSTAAKVSIAQIHLVAQPAEAQPPAVNIETGSSIEIWLKIDGRAISTMMTSLLGHIQAQANEHMGRNRKDAIALKESDTISFYLSSVMVKHAKLRPEPPIAHVSDPAHVVVPRAPQFNQQAATTGAPALPQGLNDRLANCIELIKRRVGLNGDCFTETLSRGIQEQLKSAVKNADPIEIAAAACILWEFGVAPKRIAASAARSLEDAERNPATAEKTPQVHEEVSSPVVASPEPASPKSQPDEVEELLTTEELAARIKFDARTITDHIKKSFFVEGTHYIKPFGRKILYRWKPICDLMKLTPSEV